jgi:hypothetical protein
MARPAPRHDRDAGGPADLLAAKAALRQEMIWSAMRAAKVARFPGAVGRIPNFTGAEAAAERLRALPAWQAASTVKANPEPPSGRYASARWSTARPCTWPSRDLTEEKIAAIPLLAAQRPGPSLQAGGKPVGRRGPGLERVVGEAVAAVGVHQQLGVRGLAG